MHIANFSICAHNLRIVEARNILSKIAVHPVPVLVSDASVFVLQNKTNHNNI